MKFQEVEGRVWVPTLQTMSELRGSIAIKKYIEARIEEEASGTGLTDSSIEISVAKEVELGPSEDRVLDVDPSKGAPLCISELATLLDGEGRNARFVGEGWVPEVPSFSSSESDQIAIAMTERASSKTDIHATSQVFTVRKSVSILGTMDKDFRRNLRRVQKEAMVEVVDYYESVLTIRHTDKDLKGVVKDNRVREKIVGIRGLVQDHSASAAGDPHFHNHLLLSNTAGASAGDGDRLMLSRSARSMLAKRRPSMTVGFASNSSRWATNLTCMANWSELIGILSTVQAPRITLSRHFKQQCLQQRESKFPTT